MNYINANDLNLFKHKNIVLWGAGKIGQVFLEILNSMDYSVIAFCDNNSNLWGNNIKSVQIVSPKLLKGIASSDDTMVVLVSIASPKDELIDQLKDIGVKNYSVVMKENKWLLLYKYYQIYNSFEKIDIFAMCEEKNIVDIEYIFNEKTAFIDMVNEKLDTHLAMSCFPLQAGENMVRKIARSKTYVYSLDHCPQSFDEGILRYTQKRLKVITSVRDPIAQNIDCVNAMINHHTAYTEVHMQRLMKKYALQKEKYTFKELFDIWMTDNAQSKKSEDMCVPMRIQQFVPSFCKYIADIMKEPFNKKSGHMVVSTEYADVFVYQYEKQDKIMPELLSWLGMDISVNWSCEAIENEEKMHINFSREYFEQCYSEEYVKHFYSDESIEKFKCKWSGYIT